MLQTSDIIIVSGLPRSGTSLMMQMLKSGGIEIVTDDKRGADLDNPRGYFELEAVKNIDQDSTWLPLLRGKCVKLISILLYHLPATERYRIVFMERDLEEVVRSQEAMLERRNQRPVPQAEMVEASKIHLESLANWLAERSNISVLRVGYKDLIEFPLEQARRISEFLGVELNVSEMVMAIDPTLYRNRKHSFR